jgi:coatomer subunit beta
MKATNMSCLTPEGALSGECDFLSANMYARSLFGEDALANLSIERTEGGTVTGHVRIRSKTQGIALSLGDKITMGMFVILSMCYMALIFLLSWQLKRKTSPLQRRSFI